MSHVNSEKPRILGLTASVISSKTKPNQLESLMRELESAMHSAIETASDLLSVARHGARPKIVVLPCDDYDCNANAVTSKVSCCCCCWHVRTLQYITLLQVLFMLRDLLHFCRDADFHPDLDLDPTKGVIEALTRTVAILVQLGPWCAWKVVLCLCNVIA